MTNKKELLTKTNVRDATEHIKAGQIKVTFFMRSFYGATVDPYRYGVEPMRLQTRSPINK